MLFLLFLIFPFIEIYVLFQVADEIGFLRTLGLVIFGVWFGYVLIRTRGLILLYQMQSRILQGQTPQKDVVRGVLALIAGLLFIIPGFVSDALAILCLLPVVRDFVALGLLWFLKRRIKKGNVKFYSSTTFRGFPGNSEDPPRAENPFQFSQDSGFRDVTPTTPQPQEKLPPSEDK